MALQGPLAASVILVVHTQDLPAGSAAAQHRPSAPCRSEAQELSSAAQSNSANAESDSPGSSADQSDDNDSLSSADQSYGENCSGAHDSSTSGSEDGGTDSVLPGTCVLCASPLWPIDFRTSDSGRPLHLLGLFCMT